MAAIVDLTFYRDGQDIKVGEVNVADDGTLEGYIWEKGIPELIPVASTPGLAQMSISVVPAKPANAANQF